MEHLSQVLWRERELLEILLFKMETEQALLATTRNRWLGHSTREIEHVLERLREVSLLRATVVVDVTDKLGLDSGASLRMIAEACEEPWSTIFMDHREALTTLAAEISAVSETNRELMTAGYQSVRDTIAFIKDENTTAGYTARGETASAQPTARLVDRSL